MTLKSLMRSSGSTALAALLAATLIPLDGFAAEASDRDGRGQWGQRGGHSGPSASAPAARAPSVNWGGGDVRIPQAPPRGDMRPRQVERINPPASSVPPPSWSRPGSDNRAVATPRWSGGSSARMDNRSGDNDRRGDRGRDWSRNRDGVPGGTVMGNNDRPRGDDSRPSRDGNWGRGGSWNGGGTQGGTVVTTDNGPRGSDGDRPAWKPDRNRDYADRDRNRSYGDRDRNRDRNWDRNRDGHRDADRSWRRDRDHDRDSWRHYERNGKRYSYRGWNDGWRHDNRYDWYNYRRSYGDIYRIGRYHSPYRHHRYSRLSAGFYLDSVFFGSRYLIDDPWRYRLPEAYGPYRWVRYYDDALLVDIYTGEVVDTIYDFFW
jgi:hypothetical protein